MDISDETSAVSTPFRPHYLAFEPPVSTQDGVYHGPVSTGTHFKRVTLEPAPQSANTQAASEKTVLRVADSDNFDGKGAMMLLLKMPHAKAKALFDLARNNGRFVAVNERYEDVQALHAKATKLGGMPRMGADELSVSNHWFDWRHGLGRSGDAEARSTLIAEEIGAFNTIVDAQRVPQQIHDLYASGVPESKMPLALYQETPLPPLALPDITPAPAVVQQTAAPQVEAPVPVPSVPVVSAAVESFNAGAASTPIEQALGQVAQEIPPSPQELFAAARRGDTATVISLLERGANIHADNDYALREAADRGYTETVVALLERGADIHAADDYALCLSARNGHTATVVALLERGADVHADNDVALRAAAERGYTATVVALLERGANIHAADDYALCFAARNGHTATVVALLERDADIHANNDYALRTAVECGHTATVLTLLECGANVHAVKNEDLRSAAMYGHVATVRVIETAMENTPLPARVQTTPSPSR